MLPLIHPATLLVSGATGSGKTILVFRLIDAVLDGKLFEYPIKRNYRQPKVDEYHQQEITGDDEGYVYFSKGLTAETDVIFDGSKPSHLVLDDLMSATNGFVVDIFIDWQQPLVIAETSQRAIEVAHLYLFLVEIILIFVVILVTVAKRRCLRRAATDLVDDDASHSDLPTALETPAATAEEGEETVHKDVGQAVAGLDFRVLRQHFERL